MSAAHQPVNAFIARLHMIADLPESIEPALRNIVAHVKELPTSHDIVSQGDQPSQCCVILEGWVSRNKVLKGGKPQITALHFAGAAPDLQSLFAPTLDHNITTLTPAQVGFIPHSSLRDLVNQSPALAQAFWQETLVDAAIAREWEVNLGARPAIGRIAHLFCEMSTRLERFGRAFRTGSLLSFAWPLTQTQLGEATGLSAVHVNRSLQELRASGLVEVTREHVTIRDMPKLIELAGFNPDYLAAEAPRGRNGQT